MPSSSLPMNNHQLSPSPTSTAAALPASAALKQRRLSASSHHRRRASDVQRFAAKTPALIATLNVGRPSAAATGTAGTGNGTDDDSSEAATSPTMASAAAALFRNPDLYGGSGGVSGRRKGIVFMCESCSKIYRHPSCLIKHRWEHSPHWAESSKLLLSKHQQVQLLEGAAILSHLGTAASLPEDRAVWPSWTSGGILPMPTGTRDSDNAAKQAHRGHAHDDEEDISVFDDDESAVDIDEDNDDVKELSTSATDGTLRRSLRPRSRSAGALFNVAPLGLSNSKRRQHHGKPVMMPVKGKLTQVAPGVLLAPSPPPPPGSFSPSPAHGSLSEVRPGILIATTNTTGASAPIAIAGSHHTAQSPLDVLAALSLGSYPGSFVSQTISSSLPQSSVRSSSGGSRASDLDDELPEVDEMDEMDDGHGAEARVVQHEEWDGMDLDMEM